ncbi:hypothetical protein MLD52_04690 [Puniceicoccaceae bacterium K14]|nr:hypothetical protein [Puniceicoccaceae bacterium K14]
MSIEPIIANNKTYQESDVRGKDAVSNLFSGARSQEKFNSYWDDAVAASDSSSDDLESENQTDSEEGKASSQSRTENALNFSQAPGFSGGNFSFSTMAFGRDQMSNMVEFGRIEEHSEGGQSANLMTSNKSIGENAEARIESIEDEEGESEEEEPVSKTEERRSPVGVSKGQALIAQSVRTSSVNSQSQSETMPQSELVPAQVKPTSEVKSASAIVSEKNSGVAKNVSAPAVQPSQATDSPQVANNAATNSEPNLTQPKNLESAKPPVQTVNQESKPVVEATVKPLEGVAKNTLEAANNLHGKAADAARTNNDEAKQPNGQSLTSQQPKVTEGANKVPQNATVNPESRDSSQTDGEQLAIDAEKATADLSAAMKKTKPQVASTGEARASIASENSTNANTQRVASTETSPSNAKLPDSSSGTLGTKENSQLDAKIESARLSQDSNEAKNTLAQRQKASGESTVASADAATKAANASKASDVGVHAQNVSAIRDVRSVAVQAASKSNVQSKPVSINGVTSTAVAGGASATQGTGGLNQAGSAQAQQQSSGQGEGSKQEFSANLKNALNGAKGTEKSNSEGNQNFSLNDAGSSTSTRRSDAAAKAQGTNYASKSAEEVKDIYAALSRGIDRMLSSKQDTINVKINFDQGGSIAMKLSVENGQVNTSMDTDLAGLEEAIKAGWDDLSKEWNQKGLKLNTPQFAQNGSTAKDGGFASFDQRGQEQTQSAGDSANENSNNNQRSGSNQLRRGSAGTRGQDIASGQERASQAKENTSSDSELRTYA